MRYSVLYKRLIRRSYALFFDESFLRYNLKNRNELKLISENKVKKAFYLLAFVYAFVI